MCGIAVSFNVLGTAEPLDLTRLKHRGPDGSGEWVSPDRRVWFGHTRLSILDLSPTGAQPMLDEVTGNVIVFNGEIYNHRALRKELRDQPLWRGSSDTETLLAAYRVWGADMLGRLKGMFAFAVFDASQQSLFLARDRFGIKPLYFQREPGRLEFASEIRALSSIAPELITREGLASYLQCGACPEGQLIFRGVEVVPAGHAMSVSSEGTVRFMSYWPPRSLAKRVTKEPVREVRRLLEGAVREHLSADVPVASFLSGGIDSSIITALAALEMSSPLQTFSVGFKERAFDETSIAEEMARRYRTDHHRIELAEEEVLGLVCEAVDKLDLPSVDAINTYIVARSVADHGIKVALSGLGGDELFGGYPSFRDVPKLKWLAKVPSGLRSGFPMFGARGARLVDLPDTDVGGLTAWRRRFWTNQMIEEAGLLPADALCEQLPDLPDDFARISWVELTGYMRHMLLRDSDQMSMAASLELRVPFLDHELVEFVLSLPARQKLNGNKRVKGLLVEACLDLLPPAVYDRPEMGFTLPMDAWIRGPLSDFVAAGISEVSARDLLPAETIARLSVQFKRCALHWTRLWSIVVLGHFCKRLEREMVACAS